MLAFGAHEVVELADQDAAVRLKHWQLPEGLAAQQDVVAIDRASIDEQQEHKLLMNDIGTMCAAQQFTAFDNLVVSGCRRATGCSYARRCNTASCMWTPHVGTSSACRVCRAVDDVSLATLQPPSLAAAVS